MAASNELACHPPRAGACPGWSVEWDWCNVPRPGRTMYHGHARGVETRREGEEAARRGLSRELGAVWSISLISQTKILVILKAEQCQN